MNKAIALYKNAVAFVARFIVGAAKIATPLLAAPKVAKAANGKTSVTDYVKAAAGAVVAIAAWFIAFYVLSFVINVVAAVLGLVFAGWLATTIVVAATIKFSIDMNKAVYAHYA